jgi:recombinational DNA repair protein (RecF pathway)
MAQLIHSHKHTSIDWGRFD